MAAKMKVLLENWNKFLLEEEKKDSDPCWEDYKKVGTKEKNGEEVPNCVLKKKMQESPCSNSSGMNYEEGPEASMHRTSLYTISQDANELLGLIGEEDDLPEWLESKIVLAQEYLSAARDYLSGEMGRQTGSLEEEELDEGGRCTGPTKKASSDRKGKKSQQCVRQPDGSYKRIHWGQAGVKATGDSGNTERKRAFRARHNCSNAKAGSAQAQACKDW